MHRAPNDAAPCRVPDRIALDPQAPIILAYGIGVDSTALLIELHARGETPDLVLTADPGAEKPETYEYQTMMAAWMAARGIPYEVVAYRPKRFKHYPPYATILTNLLANATLPSISLGRHSCSLKWKVAPQEAFLKQWPPAKAAWAAGRKVVRLIGYDASPADARRYRHAAGIDDPLFECRYPLRDWGWTRARCEARIAQAGLPVPPKSSCFFCGAIKPDEVRALPAWCLRLIVLIEARAAPVSIRSRGSGGALPEPVRGGSPTLSVPSSCCPRPRSARSCGPLPPSCCASRTRPRSCR